MEEYGSGEEALRGAAAASREGNPKELRGLWGVKPPPLVSTSSANTFPSLPSLSLSAASWNVSIAASICNFSSLDSLNQHSLRFKTEGSCPVPNLPPSCPSRGLSLLPGTTPFSPSVHLICFCTPELAASSFSLHPLCHSITLANRADFLSPSAQLPLAFLLQSVPCFSAASTTLKTDTHW